MAATPDALNRSADGDASPDARDDSTLSDGPLAHVRIVLSRTSHPGNIGAAARAAWTMGIGALVLVAPRRFPDADATARATGAESVLAKARVVPSLDDALADCAWTVGLSARPRELAGRVVPIRAAAHEAIARTRDGPVALVFGSEMSGLSNDELARCRAVATIPANPAYSSLNLAAAVQVAAYELRLAAAGDDVWQAPRFEPATHAAIEGLHAHAERTLAAMRFLDPAMPRRLMPRLRRLFARAGLEHEEVNILRGILARIDALLAQGRHDAESSAEAPRRARAAPRSPR
jgi:tRNA/rRNA methyltransferase